MKNLCDYLYQRCGGASTYTDKRGIQSVIDAHAELKIDIILVEKWLDLMEESLDEMAKEIPEDHRQYLLDFMRFAGYNMIVWSKYTQSFMKKGPLF